MLSKMAKAGLTVLRPQNLFIQVIQAWHLNKCLLDVIKEELIAFLLYTLELAEFILKRVLLYLSRNCETYLFVLDLFSPWPAFSSECGQETGSPDINLY
jgi:hypothetical protein